MGDASSTPMPVLFPGAATGNEIQLGTIHGVGTLFAQGCVYGEICYLIEIWHEQSGMIRTDGIIDARSEVMETVCKTEGLVLILETGEIVPIIIMGTISGHAEIRIIGPVPGFAPRSR